MNTMPFSKLFLKYLVTKSTSFQNLMVYGVFKRQEFHEIGKTQPFGYNNKITYKK